MQLFSRMGKRFITLYATVVVLLLVAAGLWVCRASANPQRVFWGMINQSLATNGVTVQAKQGSGTTSVHQTVQYSLGGENLSHSLTTLSQNGTTVTDEMIGTPTADYTRYVSITTSQKSASGKPLDFSSILGLWAKNAGTSGTGKGVLLSQAVLGSGLPLGGAVVPIGNLSPQLRSKLVSQIRQQNVYQIDFASVKKMRHNGRTEYIYEATFQPILYASMIKRFAQETGLHDLDQLDVNSFSGQQALHVTLTVDARSYHLVRASAGSGGSGVTQSYSSYDVPALVTVPQHPLSQTELQQRLANLQK
ncbi:MAG TPA: hypothetical protein VJP80_05170 [Candidatus Saccharimonadales bacterium]|nr:hypothetical protein [Candidatus Saccharimonadales bacterium]